MTKENEFLKESIPEPNFLEQANALIDEKYRNAELLEDPKDKPGLQIADHKLWISVMDLHITHVYDVLVKEFVSTVSEHYDPIMACISKVAADLEIMKDTNKSDHDIIMVILKDLTDWQKEAKEKFTKEEMEIKLIKTRLDLKKERMDRWEKSVKKKENEILAKIKAIDDEIHGEIPIRLARGYKIEKYIVAILVAVLLSTLITFFTVRAHAKSVKAAGHNGNVKIENTR